MKSTDQRISNFDARSVMLIAAIVVGSSAPLQAQPVNPAPQTQSGSSSNMPAPAAPAAAQGAFDRADANRDGHLSAKEAQNLPEIGNRFAQLDQNHDGQLSREEFEAGAKR